MRVTYVSGPLKCRVFSSDESRERTCVVRPPRVHAPCRSAAGSSAFVRSTPQCPPPRAVPVRARCFSRFRTNIFNTSVFCTPRPTRGFAGLHAGAARRLYAWRSRRLGRVLRARRIASRLHRSRSLPQVRQNSHALCWPGLDDDAFSRKTHHLGSRWRCYIPNLVRHAALTRVRASHTGTACRRPDPPSSVSYTHLTLPTICSV